MVGIHPYHWIDPSAVACIDHNYVHQQGVCRNSFLSQSHMNFLQAVFPVGYKHKKGSHQVPVLVHSVLDDSGRIAPPLRWLCNGTGLRSIQQRHRTVSHTALPGEIRSGHSYMVHRRWGLSGLCWGAGRRKVRIAHIAVQWCCADSFHTHPRSHCHLSCTQPCQNDMRWSAHYTHTSCRNGCCAPLLVSKASHDRSPGNVRS